MPPTSSTIALDPEHARPRGAEGVRLWIRPDLAGLFAGLGFEQLIGLGEQRVRTGPDGARHTSWFERGGRRFYLKVHGGVGWAEILKCWLQGKRAVVDARPEVRALERLAELGIPAPPLAGFGMRGWNPARRRSFVLTESLEETADLAEVLARTPQPPVRFRQALARELGRITGRLHAAGIAHRDLYLTHFRIRLGEDGRFELFLIDLHRAQRVSTRSGRWLFKDLAALRYSALGLALTRTDLARFSCAYQAQLPDPPERHAQATLARAIEVRARAVRARIARRGGAD